MEEEFKTAIIKEDIDFISQHIYDNPNYFGILLHKRAIWDNPKFISFISQLKHVNIHPVFFSDQFKLKKLFKHNRDLERELFPELVYDQVWLYYKIITPACMQDLWEPSISLETAIQITNFKAYEDIDKFFQKVYNVQANNFRQIPDYTLTNLNMYLCYMKYFEMVNGIPIETAPVNTLPACENKIIWGLIKFKDEPFINTILILPEKSHIFNIISEMAMLDIDLFEYIADKINFDFIISGAHYINDIDRLHKFISKHPRHDYSVPKEVLKSRDSAVLSKWFKFGHCYPRQFKSLNSVSIKYVPIDDLIGTFGPKCGTWNIIPLLVYYRNYDINFIAKALFSIFPNKCTEIVQDLDGTPDISDIDKKLSPKVTYLLYTLIANGARQYDHNLDIDTTKYIQLRIAKETEKINFLKTIFRPEINYIYTLEFFYTLEFLNEQLSP